jgi:hypothetical protein
MLREWERQLGDAYRGRIEGSYTYLAGTLRELASDEAGWTISEHAGHPVLLLAGETAFALLAFSGPQGGVTLKGALHALDEGLIRVSFSDQSAADHVVVETVEPFVPMIRTWSFDWHGRLQLTIEHWLPDLLPPIPDDSMIWPDLHHHDRQRAMAHKLASAAGWPIRPERGED